MQLTLSIVLEKEIKAKNDSKLSYLVEVVKKRRQLSSIGAFWL